MHPRRLLALTTPSPRPQCLLRLTSAARVRSPGHFFRRTLRHMMAHRHCSGSRGSRIRASLQSDSQRSAASECTTTQRGDVASRYLSVRREGVCKAVDLSKHRPCAAGDGGAHAECDRLCCKHRATSAREAMAESNCVDLCSEKCQAPFISVHSNLQLSHMSLDPFPATG